MDSTTTEHRNEVLLVGRLSTGPTARGLPSGDVVTSWRLVAERPARRTATPEDDQDSATGNKTEMDRRTVDALECATFRPSVAQELESANSGDALEVRGALRRRFWRSPSGVASRYEIEATQARCLDAVATEAPTGGGP